MKKIFVIFFCLLICSPLFSFDLNLSRMTDTTTFEYRGRRPNNGRRPTPRPQPPIDDSESFDDFMKFTYSIQVIKPSMSFDLQYGIGSLMVGGHVIKTLTQSILDGPQYDSYYGYYDSWNTYENQWGYGFSLGFRIPLIYEQYLGIEIIPQLQWFTTKEEVVYETFNSSDENNIYTTESDLRAMIMFDIDIFFIDFYISSGYGYNIEGMKSMIDSPSSFLFDTGIGFKYKY